MTQINKLQGFNDVDRTGNAKALALYLDSASALEVAKTYKRQTFALLGINEGDVVLDAGCGTGEDVMALAPLVGEKGRVVGIDQSENFISEAIKRAKPLGSNLEFLIRNIYQLDFNNDTF